MRPSVSRLKSCCASSCFSSSCRRPHSRAFSEQPNRNTVVTRPREPTNAFVKPSPLKLTEWGAARDRHNPITKAIHRLEQAVELGDMVYALRVCKTLKTKTDKPPALVFRLLMQLFNQRQMHLEVSAVFEDALALGIEPDKEMWNFLLQAHSNSYPKLSETLAKMAEAVVDLNAVSYRHIVQHHADCGNLIMCLRALQEMKDKGISPDIPTVEAMVELACREHLPRIAYGLATEYEESSSRRLNISTWTQILASSAHNFYTRGCVTGWKRLKDAKITPDEGICTMVINAAGMSRQPSLIWEALEALKILNVTLQDYHISPLITSFDSRQQIPEALDLFDFMEDNGIQPTKSTIRGLRKLLAEPEDIEAAIAHLRSRVETKGRNLAGAFNSVLSATLKGRLNYTVALGKEMEDLKVTPTIDTFNILIQSASLRRNVPAAHAYYEDVLKRGLVPNSETYERIIMLIASQTVYDDAFLYLHKMTSAKLVPSAELLVALAKKAALRYDMRWKMLVNLMEKNGYTVTNELMEFLLTNGRKHMGNDSLDVANEGVPRALYGSERDISRSDPEEDSAEPNRPLRIDFH